MKKILIIKDVIQDYKLTLNEYLVLFVICENQKTQFTEFGRLVTFSTITVSEIDDELSISISTIYECIKTLKEKEILRENHWGFIPHDIIFSYDYSKEQILYYESWFNRFDITSKYNIVLSLLWNEYYGLDSKKDYDIKIINKQLARFMDRKTVYNAIELFKKESIISITEKGRVLFHKRPSDVKNENILLIQPSKKYKYRPVLKNRC